MTHNVVVIGGGVIGLSSAWYLAQSGYRVTVIDRKQVGAACSGGNCGLVCPSHVLPLTEPGAFKAAVKAMVTPNSPFRIRPRVDPALWSWLWQFAKRCNKQSMLQAAHAIQALLASSMQEYEQWIQAEKMACEWQARGLLFTYLHSAECDAFEKTNALLAEHFNEPARKLSAEESIELEPALKPQIAGSWYYEHDAHLRPDKLLSVLRERVEAMGGQFLENCELQEVVGERGVAKAVLTPQGELEADCFLVSSGAWTPMLKRHLGVEVPIQPGKGYSLTMPRPARCPKIPIIFPEHRVVVTPMESGYRLGSVMEFAGYDESIRPERLKLLREGAEHYLHEPYCEPQLQPWYGWRPMTFDSVPVIDRSPKWENVWLAAGHNMLGLSMAPGTGRLVADLISGRQPHLDPEPYRLSRFHS